MKTIDDLLGDLAQAKRDEEVAKKKRLDCEAQLLALIAEKPDKGRVKMGDVIKATVEFKLGYKADVASIRQLEGVDGSLLPIKPTEAIPADYAFDEKAYETLRTSNPALFAKVAAFVETKPSKPSFELKL